MTVLYATTAGNASSTAPFVSSSMNINDHMTQDFSFVASYINSTRQYGKCLNLIVKYRYIGDHYFDYKPLLETLMYYSEPTPDLPMAIYWEIVNKAFVKNITSRYKLDGLSSQIQVTLSLCVRIHSLKNQHSNSVCMHIGCLSEL
jgi:hypothetical protein